jgi:hypothetical protein
LDTSVGREDGPSVGNIEGSVERLEVDTSVGTSGSSTVGEAVGNDVGGKSGI